MLTRSFVRLRNIFLEYKQRFCFTFVVTLIFIFMNNYGIVVIKKFKLTKNILIIRKNYKKKLKSEKVENF